MKRLAHKPKFQFDISHGLVELFFESIQVNTEDSECVCEVREKFYVTVFLLISFRGSETDCVGVSQNELSSR